jgi:hypothetical protein
MNCNTQNAKIASITEKTLIIGIDVGSETPAPPFLFPHTFHFLLANFSFAYS